MKTTRRSSPLNIMQERFVAEYIKDGNATRSAIAAGYSAKTAYQQGHELLKNREVKSAIDQTQAMIVGAVLKEIKIDKERVLQEQANIALADPNELISYRRNCCRYCYGKNHRYQRTEIEMEEDRAAHERWLAETVAKVIAAGKELPKQVTKFNEKGGAGWNPLREPNADCPECFGEGIGELFIADTRNLSPSARALYAGIKKTKDGIEVKMHDKQAALGRLMQHFDMLKGDDPNKSQGNNVLVNLIMELQGTSLPIVKDVTPQRE